MQISRPQLISIAAIVAITVVGLLNAQRLGVLFHYSAKRLTSPDTLLIGRSVLTLPRDAWVISSNEKGAVVGFVHDFGRVYSLHMLVRTKMSPAEALARKAEPDGRISEIRPVARLPTCYETSYEERGTVQERAMYCPDSEILFIVDGPQFGAWDRIPDLLGS